MQHRVHGKRMETQLNAALPLRVAIKGPNCSLFKLPDDQFLESAPTEVSCCRGDDENGTLSSLISLLDDAGGRTSYWESTSTAEEGLARGRFTRQLECREDSTK